MMAMNPRFNFKQIQIGRQLKYKQNIKYFQSMIHLKMDDQQKKGSEIQEVIEIKIINDSLEKIQNRMKDIINV
ncbi:unnamed protein product [Paramecium sonneborni]|uniref:Uncharacterized protein n=1 Tax=Paramecium sonneborni TaxID=65129 RepID=A0A8S1NUA3_9CILI|nr:unnamed protein product [Paramecium sonneborni]